MGIRRVGLAGIAAVAAWGCALLLAPREVRAQFDTHSRATGVEASLHVGYGTFTNSARFCTSGSSCSGSGLLDGSVGFQIHAGYRFVPLLSAGLHVSYQILSLHTNPLITNGAGSATAVGVYLQAHLLELLPAAPTALARTDVWLGVGFDFYANVTGWGDVLGTRGNVSLNGVAVPFTLGAEYAILDFLNVGIIGMAVPWAAYSSCSRADNSSTSMCDNAGRQAEGYFFFGAGVRGHFNVSQ